MPPAAIQSWNEPPSTLISNTAPSNPSWASKKFRKLSLDCDEVAKTGLTRTESVMPAGAATTAELAPDVLAKLSVTQGFVPMLLTLVHPVGNVGTATASKFWVKFAGVVRSSRRVNCRRELGRIDDSSSSRDEEHPRNWYLGSQANRDEFPVKGTLARRIDFKKRANQLHP